MDAGEGSSSRSGTNHGGAAESPQRLHRPGYITVGSGSTSENAAKLQAILDQDSGYGGSDSGMGGASINPWHPGHFEDRYTPAHTPDGSGAANPDDRRALASHVHQLFYNQNRTALGRAITQTVERLRSLQDMNATWPAHYPTVQRPPSPPSTRPGVRPGLVHTQSTSGGASFQRPQGLRRAGTSLGEHHTAESSPAGAQGEPAQEPRLVTQELAHDFSVLKIELKMEGLAQSEIVHSLEKRSVASLLDNQINNSLRHLSALRERIEDTSSKVLVTGDLNSGKSTFCNALLRRKVLPEDQQPCTAIFCEVLDVRENGGIEEVHAIPHGQVYSRNDESSYEVFDLKELEAVVVNADRYSQCKIYIRDIRSVDESLLNNGVVDIALIDAPGLNNDSIKTTALFARQEEIDVVVFVVSAANHFTLSAKEFIFNAAREKAYMFMVVNGFDNIRDKRRCQEGILKQIAHLSPATFKESSELVHFVSSNAIPMKSMGASNDPEIPNGSGSHGSRGSGHEDVHRGKPSDDDDDDDDQPSRNAKGKQKEVIDDFNELEASLRRFVLEKRARSKLAPAKTYLMNVLGDLVTLSTVNRDIAQTERDRVTQELQALEPVYEKSKNARAEVDESIARDIESISGETYALTREAINSKIAGIAEADLGVTYPGFFGAYEYADSLKAAMVEQIVETVHWCEERAREKTTEGVNTIKSLGLLHLGDEYANLTFRSEKMFRRQKDALARQADFDTEFSDFFDVASLWERQEKVASTSMAVTVAGVVGGRVFGGVGWLDGAVTASRFVGFKNARRLLIPGLVIMVALGVSYVVAQIPSSLPRRLSAKLSTELARLDYTHANSQRISAEVRRALQYPATGLRQGLQKHVEEIQEKKRATAKTQYEADVARKYFGNLVRDSNDVRSRVERVDLEGPAPGLGAAHDPVG